MTVAAMETLAADQRIVNLLSPFMAHELPDETWSDLIQAIRMVIQSQSTPLTPQQKADARAIFEGRHPERRACEHCGGIHARSCPRLKSEHTWYSHNVNTDATIVTEHEIKYWPPGDWESADITFPEEVYDD